MPESRPDYSSLPDAGRARPRPGWTIYRAVIEAADAAALAADAPSTSAWVESVLARETGIEPPPAPERGRRKKSERGD